VSDQLANACSNVATWSRSQLVADDADDLVAIPERLGEIGDAERAIAVAQRGAQRCRVCEVALDQLRAKPREFLRSG
jgi:hypothetical protein